MGKIPVLVVVVLGLWIAWTLHSEGPDKAFGGLFGMLYQSQYGENAPKTRAGVIADEVEQRQAKPDQPDDWWAE